MNKTVLILRWIAFLPAAFIAWFVMYLIIYVADQFAFGDGSYVGNYVIPVIASFAAGIAYMYAGIKTAPSHSKTVAAILLVVGVLFTAYSLTVPYREGQVFSLFTVVISVAGSALAYFALKNDIKKEEAKEEGLLKDDF